MNNEPTDQQVTPQPEIPFSDKVPTEPGDYRWKAHEKLPSELVVVHKRDHGGLVAAYETQNVGTAVEVLGGLWQGPLIPITTLKEAQKRIVELESALERERERHLATHTKLTMDI